ncbi:MAG: LytR/AlgR family response regulator transcription factor [Lachnospiraceae bacterium]
MEKLIKENHVWKIVFVSKNTERIFDIFSIKTLGFVKKPINYESIEKWLNVINNELNKNDIVKYNTGSGKGVISVNKIVYVQGERNCVLVITEDDMFMAMENLKSWEERLVKTDVVRVHKSYLVNMSYISEFGKEIKIQKRKEMIPIGRKYEKNVKQNYNQYISRRF